MVLRAVVVVVVVVVWLWCPPHRNRLDGRNVSMNMHEALRLQRRDGVAVLTFADAEHMNSFDPVLLGDMHHMVRGLLEDDGVRGVVFTGEGRAFSAGADVGAFRRGIEEGTVVSWVLDATSHLHPMLQDIVESPKPFVAAVNGVAAGGGLGLALAADARIGTSDARFAAGYFGIGASPDGGATWLLPRLIGVQRTRRFFFDNEIMDAATAHSLGLLDEIVDADILLDHAVGLAARWGAWAHHSREATKLLLERQHGNGFGAQLDLERGLIAAAAGTPDFAEGIAAFLAKRKPEFF